MLTSYFCTRKLTMATTMPLRSGQSMSRMAVLGVGIEVATRLPESNGGLPSWLLSGVPPWGYRFTHNLLNKQLRSGPVLQNHENKGDILQNIQNYGVMVALELWGDTSLRLVDSVST